MRIDHKNSQNPDTLRGRRRRYIRNCGNPALIMVDYLQLIRSPDQESRTQDIAELPPSLNALAKEFGCPVLARSQPHCTVYRRAAQRPNHRLRPAPGPARQTAPR
ncbi:DnaB-like helicase C-terminal domain-containing protein, partial [Salmonella enterica]|uniref:DnaB-like helicase C-terminal domain-containing protein n=1 Tax=Salmonella enterica TaxID=28901 RepID=UPI00398C62F4